MPIPGNIQGQDGWGSEQPGVLEMSLLTAGRLNEMALKDAFQIRITSNSVTLCSLLWFKPGSGTRQGCQLWSCLQPAPFGG